MRVAALVSGGKDSILALHRAAEEHEVVCVVGVVPENLESYMFHSTNLHMLETIADSLSYPLVKVKVSGEKELEVDELARALEKLEADAVCIGGIASEYQKRRFERACKHAGMKLIAPLWGANPEELMEEVVRNFEVIIVSVSAMGLDERFLCRRIDRECLEELKKLSKKYGFHLAGEGGEYETLVLDAPLYRFKIAVESVKVLWDGLRGECRVERFSKISKF